MMNHTDLMSKIRYWDSRVAKWLMRHFYITFFQFVLVGAFCIWFANTIGIIDIGFNIPLRTTTERLLMTISVSLGIAVFLMLLTSFWLLFIFSHIQRMTTLLKDLNYTMFKMRTSRAGPPRTEPPKNTPGKVL
jgi:hypothetical protein